MEYQATSDFLSGGGEMGALMRAYDWASSPLGPPERWPQSLRATIRLMLNSNHPMFIWWGPDLIQFYNDAYRKTMGPERHPSALGQKGRECWAEIWHIIGPQIEYVMAGRGSTWDEDRLVPVTRHGRREDVWWTYSYGPIDLEGRVGGVFVVCNDVTAQHLANEALKDQTRRLETLFEQAPGFMAVTRGPSHVFELSNLAYGRLVGGRDILGKPVAEALPEVTEQGFVTLLDDVYATGKAHVGRRVPVDLQNTPGGTTSRVYLDFVYQPLLEASGAVSGVFVQGVDTTDHVRAEQHLRLVNDELKHRVKNTLAMVSAIASQTLRNAGSEEELRAFQERLSAFGQAHDILTANAWATALIPEVVDAALRSHTSRERRFSIEGPDVVVGSKQALSLSLALHELATNAAKYGALSNQTGDVTVAWGERVAGDRPMFELTWVESGGPRVSPPNRKGFGSRLIERVLTADFGGEVEIDYAPSGLRFKLSAPSGNLGNVLPSPFATVPV